METAQISHLLVEKMQSIVGSPYVFADQENLYAYSHDETEDLSFLPDVVVKPAIPLEVSRIMQFCNEHKIPVTARGAGTGLSGAALPVHKGILLSMERFNKIIHIDEINHQATVEPGVITQVLQEAAMEKGLFYPVDPGSRGSCSLGGNLAQSSGGPRAVKYGTTRENVLNLEVVLPTGEIIWTGANVLKYSTGYNLTQLMVGSEGTLGIITKAVFKLRPYPTHKLVMLVPFASAEQACEAVNAIFMAGISPSCLEFMERDAIEWAVRYTGSTIEIPANVQAHLLIEVDGNEMDLLYKDAERIYEVLSRYEVGEVLLGESSQQQEELWALRRKVPYAVRHTSVYKEEDTVVPRGHLPQLLKGVKEIGRKYNFTSVCYGHAGDGNLHVNIIKGDMSEEEWNRKLPEGIREIFSLCVRLGGTISGEHGIGYVQKPYIGIALPDINLALMRGIKQVFDPNGILNPGKIF
ncbi:FAD-binding protein [Rhodocytophaga rosea]|uniref:FAD-binding protein n=1 Tax=Rhodocytophaga rosea TaxID=2704465 RepID=A0A6C0GCF8_9BACT|nr:FAD-linked oxidase C-terminal domain-containing protein [Rhodocytophaga rosea]QHT65651.1 FAD-binding protein [Rhodocytophaga rosea]